MACIFGMSRLYSQPVFHPYLTASLVFRCIPVSIYISNFAADPLYPAESHCNCNCICIQLYPYVSSCIQLHAAAAAAVSHCISPYPRRYGQKHHF